VLRIIDRLNVGGPALQATVLSEGLDPGRFDHRILTGTVGDAEGDYVELRAPHLPVERVRGLGRAVDPLDDVRAFAGIVAEIRRFRPHIVHTHKAKAGALGRVAAWTNRVPATVHTFHGHLLQGYFSPAKTKLVVGVESMLARRTTALVAVGAQVRDELVDAGVGRRQQYTVVPPGVALPPPPSPADARAALGLPADRKVVTFVARLTAVKRPDRFLDMAQHITQERSDVVFAIAGEGELLASLQADTRALEGRVVFLGWRSDVETVYAASDVVVLTSDNEGMPVSLIEAASIGIPAVTTRVGSAAEVVVDGSTGFVTGLDTAELAAATTKLLDDDALRRRLGANAAARAAHEFAASRLVADIADLYERLAASGGWG
jgi:glycosyltransferase involved in cell wall biosynthesis